jgi:hypothetical protein
VGIGLKNLCTSQLLSEFWPPVPQGDKCFVGKMGSGKASSTLTTTKVTIIVTADWDSKTEMVSTPQGREYGKILKNWWLADKKRRWRG